MTSCNIS